MDDQHRQPRDGDRRPVRERIERAVDAGRISAADGAIRLTNVNAAQSMTELGLVVRDLDQLEAAIQPAGSLGVSSAGSAATAAGAGVRRALPLLVGGVAVAAIAAAVIGLVAFSSSDGSGPGTSVTDVLQDPVPIGPDVEEEPGEPAGSEEAEPTAAPRSYRLDAAGIRTFLADYRKEFSTTKVVDLTMYDEYVIVRVPVAGKQRNTGWRYAGGRFDDFGPPMANFPGSAIVDTARLDLAKLLRNIATARRTLGVEEISLTYVSINYRPATDDEPNVNIYVSNAFSESGYLATTLGGRIERAFPYGG